MAPKLLATAQDAAHRRYVLCCAIKLMSQPMRDEAGDKTRTGALFPSYVETALEAATIGLILLSFYTETCHKVRKGQCLHQEPYTKHGYFGPPLGAQLDLTTITYAFPRFRIRGATTAANLRRSLPSMTKNVTKTFMEPGIGQASSAAEVVASAVSPTHLNLGGRRLLRTYKGDTASASPTSAALHPRRISRGERRSSKGSYGCTRWKTPQEL